MRIKHTFRLPPKLSSHLVDYAARKRVTQALVVETALASYLSPDSSERMEAALTRRLDRMSRQLERLERDVEISNEAISLFVQFWLTTTPPLPESELKAARILGQSRHADFIAALGERVGGHRSLAGDIEQQIDPIDSD
ncbi:MAG: CopG family transcriptional regulator [Parasphingorhabdus sp.]|mgnify:CR=1 FL=1|uniref:CopG family transcriptional regulator n=1 Tax=Parasphingorhabdus sp. TaxID=2709688 RepID=UPI0030037800